MIFRMSVSICALYVLVMYVYYRLNERQRRHIMGLIALVFGRKGIVKKLSAMCGMGVSTIYKGAREMLPLVHAVEAGMWCTSEFMSEFIDGEVGDGFLEDGQEKSYFEATASPETNPKVLAMRKPAQKGRPRKKPVNYRKKAMARQRKKGAGAKKYAEKHPLIYDDIYNIIEMYIAADPMGRYVWTSKSSAKICDELMKIKNDDGTLRYPQRINKTTIQFLLHEMGYSLQRNAKMAPPVEYHVDRDLQFRTIAEAKRVILDRDVLFASIDEKKKELIGNFAGQGPELRGIGDPRVVETYTFTNANGEEITAVPYGIYDVKHNIGFVTLGVSKSTPEFAINCLRDYLKNHAAESNPGFKTVVITCDGGGNNSSRSRVWKAELAKLATELGITIFVLHYPPYTSKYNVIEHRLFSEISKNWRGKPLESLEVMAALIRGTTTRTGLKVECTVDLKEYETGHSVSNKEFSRLMKDHVKVFDSNGWNYMIYGRTNPLKDVESDASAIANAIIKTVYLAEAKKAVEDALEAEADADEKLDAASKRLDEVSKAAEQAKNAAELLARSADEAKQKGLPNAANLSALATSSRDNANKLARTLGKVKSTVARLTAAKEEATQAVADAKTALERAEAKSGTPGSGTVA